MNPKTTDQFRIDEDVQVSAECLCGAQSQRLPIKSPTGVGHDVAQKPGFLTAEQFDVLVRTQEMSHPVGGLR
jgi:hypothetical protein